MNLPSIIQCRYCGGPRPSTGLRCCGCGMPVENATLQAKPKRACRRCPRCKFAGPHVITDPERSVCGRCRAVFEADDFCFLDDRPEVNLAKKEALARRKHT